VDAGGRGFREDSLLGVSAGRMVEELTLPLFPLREGIDSDAGATFFNSLNGVLRIEAELKDGRGEAH
jgi:hypothetical protein